MGEIVDFDEFYNKHEVEKKKRRKAGSIRWILIALLLICCFMSGFLFAQSEYFYITEIEIIGNEKVSDEEILALSGIETGIHILNFNTTTAYSMLSTEHLIESVEITREYPNKVIVNVTERQAAAAIQVDDGVLLVDLTSIVLEKLTVLEGLSLVIITGLDIDYNAYSPSDYIDSSRLRAGLGVIERMTEDSAAVVSLIDVTNEQQIELWTIYNVKMKVGDGKDFSSKFDLFMDILRDEVDKGNLSIIDYIDVSVISNPAIKYNTVTVETEGEI